jgi:hypothetical protein
LAIDTLKGEGVVASKRLQEFELRQEVVNSYLEANKKGFEDMR